jgi:cytochrome c biogenesis protein CcdA
MLRLLILVISIGLADSINPSTIGPALFFAAGDKPRSRVIEFTAAVFLVSLAAGVLIALGPGQLIRNAIPDIDIRRTVRYLVEIVAGVALLAAAAVLWQRRHRLVARGLPAASPKRSSSIILGATIVVVELPTAFPYFAAIAAIIASGFGPVRQLVLLVAFNVAFTLPLIGIAAAVTFGGEATDRILRRSRRLLERRWPQVLAILIGVVGLLAVIFGVTGLASGIHGHVGHFLGHMRRTFHLHP